MTAKNGFSVVAPIRTTTPSSTSGKSTSCWALLKRWISSTKRMVRSPCSSRLPRARVRSSRTSLVPAATALSVSNRLLVWWAMTWARAVLPVPGGPWKMSEPSRSASNMRRRSLPGPTKWSWPTNSSMERGRMRAASGRTARRLASDVSRNRSMADLPRSRSHLGEPRASAPTVRYVCVIDGGHSVRDGRTRRMGIVPAAFPMAHAADPLGRPDPATPAGASVFAPPRGPARICRGPRSRSDILRRKDVSNCQGLSPPCFSRIQAGRRGTLDGPDDPLRVRPEDPPCRRVAHSSSL